MGSDLEVQLFWLVLKQSGLKPILSTGSFQKWNPLLEQDLEREVPESVILE